MIEGTRNHKAHMLIRNGNSHKEGRQRGIYRYIVSIISILCFTSGVMSDAPKIGFWEKQRKGANQQNERHRPEWYKAAGELGTGLCSDFTRCMACR